MPQLLHDHAQIKKGIAVVGGQHQGLLIAIHCGLKLPPISVQITQIGQHQRPIGLQIQGHFIGLLCLRPIAHMVQGQSPIGMGLGIAWPSQQGTVVSLHRRRIPLQAQTSQTQIGMCLGIVGPQLAQGFKAA